MLLKTAEPNGALLNAFATKRQFFEAEVGHHCCYE